MIRFTSAATGFREVAKISGVSYARLLVAMIWLLLGFGVLSAVAAADGQTNAFRFVELSGVNRPVAFDAVSSRQFAVLPKGTQVFHGVPFQVGEPIGLSGIESTRNGDLFPAEIPGVQVGVQAKRLHLLHGSISTDRDGVPLAKVVLHYAGGATESFRLGYGVHSRVLLKPRLEKKTGLADPNSQIAWAESDQNGRGGESRLYQTAWENPRPGEVITSIDLVSLFSRASPLFFAITAETGDSRLPRNLAVAPRKIFNELNALKDSVYRDDLIVRVTDAQDQRAITNAIAGLTITDDGQTYYFGEARADANGVCRVAYPPQQTVAFHLLVRGQNHLPLVISQSRTNRGEFSREFTASLQRGVNVGGVVKSEEGKPIAGAEVLVHQVVKNGPREYTRTDYDTAVTDQEGKWSSGSLPAGFEGFSFQLTHPDYRPALYTMPGFAEPPTNRPPTASGPGAPRMTYQRLPDGSMIATPGPGPVRPLRSNPARPSALPTVTSNALLSATAEMTMQPAIPVSGTVLDSDGSPIPNTEVVFQRNNPFYERKYLRTDAQGRFRMTTPEPGDGTLNVFRNGHSPQYEMVNIQPGLAPIEIRLSPARVLRGRVLDRQQRPVNGAKVRLDEWQGTSDLVHFETLTDEQGRFAWTGAPPGQVTFYVNKTNYFNMRSSFSGLSDDLTLYLNRAPGISGKVVDADTKKPIASFSIIKGRKYSPNDEQIHWERYDTVHGRNGEYTARIQEYYFQPEARIMVEAPGYIPQISPGWQNPDSYTQDFALKKGKGISGVVQNAAGAPVPNATLLLVDKGESGSMDSSSRFRPGSNGDFARTDASGHFEFSPKLDAEMILVAHDEGFAEARADQLAGDGRIVLKPWGRLKGVLRIGDPPAPERWVRLQNRFERFPGRRSSALSLYLKADPDETGSFVFENVPPGEHRVYLEYPHFGDRNYGETPLSHGLPVTVKLGETAEVLLGGTGRNVTGRVKVIGGDPSDVDWRRDVHKLTLAFTNDPVAPPDMSGLTTASEQQNAWAAYNKRQSEFWNSAAGHARELAERTYVLLFDTNSNFHVDNVPPGLYNLQVNPTEPQDEYNRRPLGAVGKLVVVPDEPGAKVNQPFDVGTLDLTIQGMVRIGKMAPPFEGQTLEGKPIKLTDFRGQPVLLYFWAAGAVSTFDLQILKELQNSFGKDNRLIILGLNLDPDAKTAQQFVKANGMTWPQAYLGPWGQTQVPAAFGVDGYPTGLLIDRDGKLAAKQLRGSLLRNTVRSHLSTETTVRLQN